MFSDQSQTIYPSPSDLFPETQDYGKFRLLVVLLSIIDTVRTQQQRSEEIEDFVSRQGACAEQHTWLRTTATNMLDSVIVLYFLW